jgi:uncharacterized protein (TIGR02231 family)
LGSIKHNGMNRESNQGMSQKIETRIAEVTVYTNQALVTRCSTVSLSGNEQELVISGLPLTMQTDSVLAKGNSILPVKLIGVRIEKIFATEIFARRVVQISQQIRQLEEQQRSLRDTLASLGLQQDFVQGLGEKSVERYSGLLSPEKISLSEIKEFLEFLGQQHGEYAKTIAQREKELQDIDKQLDTLRQQRQQMLQPAYKETLTHYNIIVTIAPEGACELELEVSYLVNRAIWTPFYDLRTSSKAKRLNLNYLAEIRQKTGEDWTGVSLRLSTAKPALSTLFPKLKPWYIDSLDTTVTPNLDFDRDGDFAELEALLADESDATKKQKIVEAQKVVKQAESVVNFRVDGLCNIPADAAAHRVTILSQDCPCLTQYVAVPRLYSFAYLEATVKNSVNGQTLLPGKANIFRDRMLVGTTQLEKISPGEEFKLNLGIDEGLKVERELIEREVQLIGNNRRTTYGYRVAIANLRQKTTTLRLIEQLPVSRNEQIKVQLTSTIPAIALGEMGQLEWLLTLQRQSRGRYKQELYYQFRVEHPADLTPVSLDI